MDEEQLDFGGNSPLKMEEESAESVEVKQETTTDAPATVDQPQKEEAKKEDEVVKVEEGTGADRWARRARSPQAFPGGRGDGEQSSGWRSSGRFRETDEATSSHTRDEPAPPPTGPSRRDPPTGPSRRIPPPPPAPHTDSIRPADSRLPKGASFQPGTPPPNRTVYLYRLHIPQGSSRFGAALIGPSGSIQKELLRAANLLTFTIEPRFNRYADLCGSKRSVQRGLKLIRDMAEKHMGDEVGKGKFAELDESRLETWPGAWLEDRFVGPENGNDEDGGHGRGGSVAGLKAGNGRGRSRERNGVDQDEFGRSRRPASADRSPSPPSRRPSPPRRSRSPSRRHSNRDRSLSPRRGSPSPRRSSRRPSVSNDPPRGTFRSSDAPPPHRTCLRLNTTFPIRKVGGVFYGPNGTMLDRFRDAVGLVSFEIRMTQALYAIAVLVGSEGAIRRGLGLIERVTYEETSAAWNNWEKNKLSDRGWVRFRRQDVLVEEGLWLEEKFSDPADGPPNEQLPPPPFLPGAGPRDLAFADMHLPGVEPPQAKFGGGGGGGGIRGRYRDPSPPRSGSGRAGERWGRDGGRDEDRWASGSGSARGGGGRMESDNGWGRRAERGRDRSRSRSRDRRRSPSPLSSRRSRRDSDAGRSSRRSPSPPPRRSRRDSDASRSSRRRSPARERSRSRSRSRDRRSSRREKRARSLSRERSVRGASPEKKRRMSMKEENKEINGENSIVRVIPIPNSAAPKFLGGSPNVVVIEDLSGCTISLVSSSTSNSVRLEGPDQSSIDQALADVQRVVERVEKGWKLPSSGGEEGKKERRRRSRDGVDESDRVKRRKTEEQSPATARSSRASPSPLSPLRPSPPPPPSATRSKSSLAESD